MRGLILGGGLLLGALAAINKLLVLNAGAVESRLEGPTRFYHWRYQGEIHSIFYKSVGEGPPILLVHSIHGAASSFEMRKIHSALADEYTVYTLDLLGFGLSDRPAIHYDADVYITLIYDFILFNLLTSRATIRHWLKEESFFDPTHVSVDVEEAYYKTSHQENARFAPAAAYSGRLNLKIVDAFRSLDKRVLIAWGREARWATVDQSAAFRRTNPNARLRVFDRCGILVHDECAEELAEALKHTPVDSEQGKSKTLSQVGRAEEV